MEKEEERGVVDDFFAFLVEDVLLICLPQSCRKNPPGPGSPEKIYNYGNELSQYSLKSNCVWGLSFGISSDPHALSFPLYLFFCTHGFCRFGARIGWTQTALCSGGLASGRPRGEDSQRWPGRDLPASLERAMRAMVVVLGSLVRFDGPLSSVVSQVLVEHPHGALISSACVCF